MQELRTRFVKNLPEESGISNSGKEWRKQTFITTSDGQYPVTVAFVIWGDKTALVKNLNTGQEITVKFEVSSREYSGKYYSEIKAFNIEQHGQQQQALESKPAVTIIPEQDSLHF